MKMGSGKDFDLGVFDGSSGEGESERSERSELADRRVDMLEY